MIRRYTYKIYLPSLWGVRRFDPSESTTGNDSLSKKRRFSFFGLSHILEILLKFINGWSKRIQISIHHWTCLVAQQKEEKIQ